MYVKFALLKVLTIRYISLISCYRKGPCATGKSTETVR